jgi:MFS family permease
MVEAEQVRAGATGVVAHPDRPETRNPFATANYRWWWAATICGALAVGLQFVTVPLFVVDRVGADKKELAIAAALFSQLITSACLMLVGGVVADRVERRSILLRCYSIAAVVSTGYLFLTGFDVRQIWPVFILAAAVGSADAFSMPARMSMAPSILPRAQLQNGIILGTVAFMTAGQFLGPSVAGFIADGPGLKYAFATEVFFLALAALIATRLKSDRPTPTGRSVFGDLGDGIRFARGSPVILGLLFMMTLPPTFLMGPTRETTVFMVRDVWHESDKFIGVANGAFGAGVLFGSLALTTIRLRRRGLLLTGVSTVVGGFFFVLYGASEIMWIALGFQLVFGIFAALFMNNATPLLQEHAMGPMLGRVMSMSNLMFALGQPLGVVQSAIVTRAWGPQASIISSGVVFMIIGALAVIFLRPVRNLD